MINLHDPDGTVACMDFHLCPYHKINPGGTYAGCTCSSTYYTREATAKEREENRTRRIERDRKHGEALAQIFGMLNT